MIPRIIQFHWFFDPIPNWLQQTIEEYRRFYSGTGWDIRFYAQVPTDIPGKYKKKMYDAPHSRYRADLLRWWLLYRDGGIYVDADTRPVNSLEPLREHKAFVSQLPFRVDKHWPEIYCVGSEPGLQLWLDALEGCLNAEKLGQPDTWFYIYNVLPNMFDYEGIAMLHQNDIRCADRQECLRFISGERPPLHGGEYLVHYGEFNNRICPLHQTLIDEQADPTFVKKIGCRQKLSPQPETFTRVDPPVNFHEMPNGDLVCDPGGPRSDKAPEGYVQDSEQWFRFHPKPKQSLSDTVQQGAEKRRNCPTCKNRGVE